MLWVAGAVANGVTSLAYFAIAFAILRPLVRERQVLENPLGLATALIFFTCAVHHGSHTVKTLLPVAYYTYHYDWQLASSLATRQMFDWEGITWDIFTAGVGIYYWTLRRTYGSLMQGAKLFEDLREKDRQTSERTALLEASNQELEAFSYSISHDLRAPLRAIDGYARILLEENAATLEPAAVGYLTRIDANAKEMEALIQALLEFSRLGRQPLAVARVEPARIVGKALDTLKAQMTNRHVDVKVVNMPGCDADPTLLRQVYVNLLSNALKFTQNRAVAQIEVGSMAGTSPPIYFVKDNGAGFDMAYKDKLFAVFQRLHRKDEYDGTGVGLAIVERIVTRHGGRIWAEGYPGSGAIFYFTLAADGLRTGVAPAAEVAGVSAGAR